MILVMAVSHFLEQPLQPGRFPPHEAMVCVDDVTGERLECGLPPLVRILGTGNTVSRGQPLQDLFEWNAGRGAGIFERPVASTAVVDPEGFEDSNGVWIVNGDFTNRLILTECHHSSSIVRIAGGFGGGK